MPKSLLFFNYGGERDARKAFPPDELRLEWASPFDKLDTLCGILTSLSSGHAVCIIVPTMIERDERTFRFRVGQEIANQWRHCMAYFNMDVVVGDHPQSIRDKLSDDYGGYFVFTIIISPNT